MCGEVRVSRQPFQLISIEQTAKNPHVAGNYPAYTRTYPQGVGGGQKYRRFEADTGVGHLFSCPRNWLGGGQGRSAWRSDALNVCKMGDSRHSQVDRGRGSLRLAYVR